MRRVILTVMAVLFFFATAQLFAPEFIVGAFVSVMFVFTIPAAEVQVSYCMIFVE